LAARGKKGRSKKKAKKGRLGALVGSFLFGEPLDDGASARVRELTGLAMIGAALWLFLSLWTFYTPPRDAGAAGKNLGGLLGHYLADGAFRTLGVSGYLLAVLGVCWGCIIVARKKVDLAVIRIMGAGVFVISFAFVLDLGFGPDLGLRETSEGLSNELPYGPGGYLAYVTMPVLVERFGSLGLWILLLTTSCISFMLATEMAFYPAVRAFGEWVEERQEVRGEGLARALWSWVRQLFVGLWDFLTGADLTEPAKKKAASKKKKKAEPEDEYEEYEEGEEEEDEWEEEPEDEYEEEEEEEEEWEEEEEEELIPPSASGEKKAAQIVAAAAAKLRQTTIHEPRYDPPTPPPGPWTLPPLDLLEPPTGTGALDKDYLEKCARDLENALKSFRVEAEVVGAQVGPAVTMFELTVAQGTRMNKVTQLSQEIAATLRAQSVRIIAPIPGKSTIGIEVPNAKRRMVRISELVSQKAYDKSLMALPLFLGMDAEGNAIVEDLARMPHLLIAGTTGSGKSVCINTILASALLTRSPHDVKMILIDPKMVELQMFQNIPHLELPVVTDMKQATNVLLWAVEKMESRYELFKRAGVKNIKMFNALGEEKLRERMGDDFNEERTPRHQPYIVLVIDEMADLMMQSKKEAENAITRLAQKSRAVGIHVIVATQRPSTDVITGVIKGNLPTRIAFQVSSRIDSRVILDSMGAEKLLGQGDMLYNPPQTSLLRRVQGALVEDHELQALVDFVCQEATQTFNQELIQVATGTAPPGALTQGGDKVDDMFNDAVTVVLKSKRGSASLLQRALGIGYTRASRLIDQMTDAGILGDHRGSKSREIMMTLEDWEENLDNIAESEGS
jgi:DNA segregation ATPase FtsK/SpoIIIE, S-DNA-T family